MKYMKVRKEADGQRFYKMDKSGRLCTGGELVGGELFTLKEYNELVTSPHCFEWVEVKKIYFCFGLRFEL